MSAVVVLLSAMMLMVCANSWFLQAERALPTTSLGSLLVTLSSFGAMVCLALPILVKIPVYLIVTLSARPRDRARMPDAAIQAVAGMLTFLLYAIIGVTQ